MSTSQTFPGTQKGKKGRKGTKIFNAFNSVPSEPVNLEEFAEQHDVSVKTLRQVSRFDKTGLPGKVIIKKDRASSEIRIWREEAEAAATEATTVTDTQAAE